MLVIISETCTKKSTPAGMFGARKNRKAQFHNGLISECKLSGGNIGQLFCVQKSAFRGDRQFFQQTILIQKRKPPGRIVFPSAVPIITRAGPGAKDYTVQGKGNIRRPYITESGASELISKETVSSSITLCSGMKLGSIYSRYPVVNQTILAWRLTGCMKYRG